MSESLRPDEQEVIPKRDPFGPSKKLMRDRGTVEEYEETEPSLKTDHAAILIDYSSKQITKETGV